MKFLNIFKLSYYFDSNATATFPGFWWVVGILAAILIASYVLSWRIRKLSYFKRTVWGRVAKVGMIVGWLGLLWVFFRYEGAVYLSWRFWPLALFIYVLVEAYLLWRFIKKEWPVRVARGAQEEPKQKYIREFKKRSKKRK